MQTTGMVYLVGAGPGRPELITVRGLDLIKTADCIITDRLASSELLSYAKDDAEIIYTPKGIGLASVSQSRINQLLVQRALEGKVVVRLKGGDPCLFARTAQELDVLARAGIAFEIVPGVTAATGASAYTGVMLTDRDIASEVVFVTGHQADDKQISSVDWAELARFNGTIVLYMAVNNLKQIVDALIGSGMDPATASMAIADATLPTQRVIRQPISRLADACRQEGIEPPAIVLIGQVAASDRDWGWFGKLPLYGKRILCTRDKRGNQQLGRLIRSYGGQAIGFETIRSRSIPILDSLSRLKDYHLIVFFSRYGVESFFGQLQRLSKDARVLAHVGIAAIGPSTAGALLGFGIRADIVPKVYTSNELCRELVNQMDIRQKRILLIRSQLADDQVRQVLEASGAIVDQVVIYTLEPANTDPQEATELIRAGRIDCITFASASEVRFFFDRIDPALVKASHSRIASIGPVTSKQILKLGLEVHIEAPSHTAEGLVNAIIEAYR